MSRNAEEDSSASPETELLLSSRVRGDMPMGVCIKAQTGEQMTTDESHRGGVSSSSSSSSPTSQDKSTGSNCNAQVEGASSNPIVEITPPSIIVNDGVENDDPPPYSSVLLPPYNSIASPNHVGWPNGPFSFDNSYSTNAPPYTVEIPLTFFQTSQAAAATNLRPEETNHQHASFPMSLRPYRFFKLGYRGSLRETWLQNSRIEEKIEDRSSRKCGAILVATAVIIFLMALSLMVRFIMEKSWWRR